MADSLKRAAAGVESLPRRIVESGAARFDVIARETASRAVGGSLQLHARRGRRPTVKLRTTAKMAGEGTVARAFVRATPAGPWRWLESGTASHEIGARRGRGGRSSRTAKFLKGATYPHPVLGPVRHPGSRGKRTWTQAIATYRAEAVDFAARDLREVIRG